MSNINPNKTLDKMIEKGISKETLSTLEYSGIELKTYKSMLILIILTCF